jgi:hypothetical protein
MSLFLNIQNCRKSTSWSRKFNTEAGVAGAIFFANCASFIRRLECGGAASRK